MALWCQLTAIATSNQETLAKKRKARNKTRLSGRTQPERGCSRQDKSVRSGQEVEESAGLQRPRLAVGGARPSFKDHS